MNASPEAKKKTQSARRLLYLCVAGVTAFIIWAFVGVLAVGSISPGEVVPASQGKTVQHLEGGIVREIAVKEGDQVIEGQSLVVLESTTSGADVTELVARINGLKIEIARLTAEAAGAATLKFDKSLVQANPEFAREEEGLFYSRRERLKNERTSQTIFISQRKEENREILARVRNARQSLKLLNEQISISEQLLKEDLSNRYTHLNLLKEASALNGTVEEGEAAIERSKMALKQARINLKRIQDKYDEETRMTLEGARRQLDELLPRLTKYQDSLQRTVLRSPVSGVIKTVYIATIGGVVGPGEAVVDIVPGKDQLVIEARLPTQDVGFVQAGQSVLIKLASPDVVRFDNLEGKVITVSPDTLTSIDGQPFYRVRIETERDYFKRGGDRYQLFPGMQVIASIHTGQRTVMQYLLDPFLSSVDNALTER